MSIPLNTLVMREREIVVVREDNTPSPPTLTPTPTPTPTFQPPPNSFVSVPDHMEREGVTEGGLLYVDTSASALHVLVHHLPQSYQSQSSQEESSGHLPTQLNYFQEGVFNKLVKEDESQEQFVVVGALKNDNLTTSSLPTPCNLSVENILTGYGEVNEEEDDTETTMILDSVPHITLEEIIQKFASSPTSSPFENSLETPTAITTITQPLQPLPPPPPPPPPVTSNVRVKILGESREGEGLLGDDDGCLYDEVVTYRCRLCGNVYEEKEDLLKHHKLNHKQKSQQDVVKIKITTSSNNTANTTTSHHRLDKEHTNENNIVCCTFCSLDFQNLREYQEHMKKTHTDRKAEGMRRQYQSQGTVVHYPTQPGMLIGHRKSRSSCTTTTTTTESNSSQVDGMGVEDSNDCDGVDKGKRKVKTPRLLQEQYWLHKQKPKPVCLVQVDKTFRCPRPSCKYKFSSEANLESHLECHGGGKEGEERGFTCSNCSSDYEKWPLCQLHLWKAHGVDIDLLTCGICHTYKTCTQQQLFVHQQIHSELKEHVCKTCDKRFKQLAQLLNHQVTHINDEKDLPAWAERSYCEECQRWFKDSRALRKHVNLIHLKRKPYSCPHCPYRCSRKSDLKVHIRRHTDERPHHCPLCGWQARDHNVMRKHKLAHQDIRPFRCPAAHCQFKNRNATYFKRHMARLHPKNEAIFKCQFCPEQTVSVQDYISHSRKHEKFLVEEAMRRRRQEVTVIDDVGTGNEGKTVTDKGTFKPTYSILTNTAAATTTTTTTPPESTVTLHNLEDMNQRMEFVTIKFDGCSEEEKVSSSNVVGSFGVDPGCSGVSLPQVVVNNGQYILHLPQDLSTVTTTTSSHHDCSTSLQQPPPPPPPPSSVITSSQPPHVLQHNT